MTVVARLSRYAGTGSLGVHLVERAGGILIGAVDGGSDAEAEGLQPGLRLTTLIAGDIAHDLTGSVSLRALVALLRRHDSVTLHCELATDADMEPAMCWHEDTPVIELSPLLSPAEVSEVHRTAASLARSQAPHVYDLMHESLFLHADGFVWKEAPALFSKIVSQMQQYHVSDTPLGVRCVEYHTYRKGGALLDPDHRDMGSVLTLSALLVDPDTVDGGTFMT